MTYSLAAALTPGANENITDVATNITTLASDEAARYRTVFAADGWIGPDIGAATHLLGSQISGTLVSMMQSTNGADLSDATPTPRPPAIIYFDDADFTLSGLTPKLRVRFQVATNATAPAITFTAGLYPVTVAGGADAITYTAGTVVSGSTVAHATPSASTITAGTSGDFTVPSDGAFLLAVVTSGSIANNAVASCHAQLQVRAV